MVSYQYAPDFEQHLSALPFAILTVIRLTLYLSFLFTSLLKQISKHRAYLRPVRQDNKSAHSKHHPDQDTDSREQSNSHPPIKVTVTLNIPTRHHIRRHYPFSTIRANSCRFFHLFSAFYTIQDPLLLKHLFFVPLSNIASFQTFPKMDACKSQYEHY